MRRIWNDLSRCCLCLLLCGTTGCTSSDSTKEDAGAERDSAADTLSVDDGGTKHFTKLIGKDGGELATDDDAFRLIIPPDALASSVEITISVRDPSTLSADGAATPAVYQLEPDGTQFNRPIAISIPQKEAPPSGHRLGVGRYDEQTKTWGEVEGSTLYEEDNRVVAMTDHFSYYGGFYYQGLPVLPITHVKVEPAILMDQQPAQIWWSRWEAVQSRTLTISGRTSPDGKGTWSFANTGESGSFDVINGAFSFTYKISAKGFGFPVLKTEAGSGYWLEVWCGQDCPPPDDGGAPGDAGVDVATDGGARPSISALWSKRYNGTADVDAYAFARCPNDGTLWVTGTMNGTIDFGSGALTSYGGHGNVFLAEFDASGNNLFSQNYYSTTTDDMGKGIDVICTSAGNVVVVGKAPKGTNFGGADLPGTTFIAVFTQSGGHIASNSFEFAALNDVAYEPTSGNYFVVGNAGKDADFGYGKLGQSGILVARFGGATAIWTKVFENAGAGYMANEVEVGSNSDIWVAGNFNGTVSFGGPALTSTGNSDAFLAHLAGTDASHLHSTSLGGSANDWAWALAVHQGPTDTVFLGVDNYSGFTVAQFDDTATAGWSKKFGTGIDDRVLGIGSDADGNVIFTGSQKGPIDFGGGSVDPSSMSIYVTKLSGAGQYLWAQTYEAVGLTEGQDVTFDSTNAIYILGSLGTTSIDFGNGPLTHTSIYKSPALLKFAP